MPPRTWLERKSWPPPLMKPATLMGEVPSQQEVFISLKVLGGSTFDLTQLLRGKSGLELGGHLLCDVVRARVLAVLEQIGAPIQQVG